MNLAELASGRAGTRPFVPPALPKESASALKKLRARHRRICQYHAMGMKNVQIALQLNITPQAVGYCLNSEVAAPKIEELVAPGDEQAKDISASVKEALPKAMMLLEEVLDNKYENTSVALKVKVAQDLLDRGGHGKVTRVQGDFRHGYFGQNGLEEIKERAKELGILATKPVEGEIIDA